MAFLSAYVYPLFKPEHRSVFGGAEVDQYNLALYLARKPYIEVTFYTGDYGQAEEAEMIDGVWVKKVPLFGWHNKSVSQKFAYAYHLFKTLWMSDADVILTEMADDTVGWAAVFFKALRKRRFIHRLASDRDTDLFDATFSGKRRSYYLYRMGLKKADLIFSQTRQQQKMLKERMGFESEILSNGFFIDHELKNFEKNHILWVGRCTPLKRPELFVDLARRIPRKQFVMIMTPPAPVEPERFRTMASEMVAEVELIPNLTILEFVPFNKIQQYFNRAQLFVNTSEYEGFPNTFVQSCLGSTPIASLKVDPDRFIVSNNLGVTCEDDFEKLVTFVQNLTDRQIAHLGANALEYVKKHHDIKIMGGAYEKAFAKLIEQNYTGGNYVKNR